MNTAKIIILTTITAAIASSFPVLAEDKQWQLIIGSDALHDHMSGAVIKRKLSDGEISRGEYFADGTGIVYEYGASFPRTWEIKGDDQVCISAVRDQACFTLEQSTSETDVYRGRNVLTGVSFKLRVTHGTALDLASESDVKPKGSASTASASEVAAELSNPNSILGTLNANFDFIQYDGNLDGANDQSAFRMTFQPSLPYPISDTTNFFFRPAIPIIIKQPVPNNNGGFDSKKVELGDIGFDASFGINFKQDSGTNVLLAGMAGTLPTATDDALGLDQWLLGPELGGFIVRKWGVLGVIANHQWDVAGDSDFNTSITGGQYVYAINLKEGWQITGSPVWSYNHNADSDDAWTLPLGIGVSKTVFSGGRPIKLSVSYWNYVEAADAFGPKHLIRFTIGPVVKLPWKGSK